MAEAEDRPKTGPGPGAGAPGPLHVACYLDAPSLGGSAASLATLLAALDPDIAVTVVGTTAHVVDDVAAARPGSTTHVLPPVRNKADVRSIARHVGALRRIRPDIVHANLDSQWTGQYGLLAAVVTRTPAVAVVHSVWSEPHPVQAVAVRRLARRVDAYVAVSAFAARATEALLRLRPGAVRVIANGVAAPGALAPPPDLGVPVVGAVGRLSPEKGIDVLLRAMALVPDARLVVVGEGPQRPELEALARRLGIAGRVTFAGWADPPWAATWSFDVLAVPSFTEGFGLVVVEAMLAGIPVVATAVGAIPEVVHDQVTGMLVAPGDPSALGAALRTLLGDPDRRRQLAAAARAEAALRFTTQRMASAFEALYAELASHRCQ